MRYGYYFGEQVWFAKSPFQSEIDIDPNQLADVVFRRTTKDGIGIEACCDGLIIFDFSNSHVFASEEKPEDPEQRSGFEKLSTFLLRRIEVLKAHSLLLKESIASKQSFGVDAVNISPNNIVHLSDAEDPNQGHSFKSRQDSWRFCARYKSTYNPTMPPGLDERVRSRQFIVNEDTLNDAIDHLEACVDHPDYSRCGVRMLVRVD